MPLCGYATTRLKARHAAYHSTRADAALDRCQSVPVVDEAGAVDLVLAIARHGRGRFPRAVFLREALRPEIATLLDSPVSLPEFPAKESRGTEQCRRHLTSISA